MVIKQIFSKAEQNSLIIKKPAMNLEIPRYPTKSKRALSDDEKQAVVAADFEPKSRAFIDTMLYAGLRKGEVLSLTINDVNLDKREINVNKNWLTENNRPKIKSSPKTAAGNRIVPIPQKLYDSLVNYLATVDGSFLFTSSNGELMSATAYRHFWDRILDRINVASGGDSKHRVIASDLTAHICRHTYATMLYYVGVDLKSAQYLLGHATVRMTMELYTHLDTSKAKQAVSAIDIFLNSSQNVVESQ